jgi:hypothetical protein
MSQASGPPSPSGDDPRSQPRFVKSTAAPDAPAAAQPTGKRFLGGMRGRQQTGDWYRLFMTGGALLMTLILLGVSLWYLFGTKYRPLLIVLAVTDYESELIPPIAFASQDADEIRRTQRFTQTDPGMPGTGNRRQTRRDFEQLFSRDLQSVQNDTVVVYLIAHGVSGPQGGYLLHSEVNPEQPGNGYPLEYVLQQLAACPARNKLLILDVARLDGNLDLGLLGNDFVLHLKQEVQQLQSRLAADSGGGGRQNLWVLCSGSEGQTAGTSHQIGLSAFGAAVAYCLHGGPEVERQGEAARRDGVLSVREIGDYVEQCVSSWSLQYRGMLQKPFYLAIGDDFPLVPVDTSLSADRFFASRVPLLDLGKLPDDESSNGQAADGGDATAPLAVSPADDKPDKAAGAGQSADDPEGVVQDAAENSGKPQAATADAKAGRADEAAKPSDGAGDSPPTPAPPSTEQLLAQTQQFWQQRTELAAGRAVFDRPRHWSLFQQELLRAEQFVFAGDLRTADRLLSRSIPALAATLTAPVERPEPPAWSLASLGTGPGAAQQRDEFRAQLAKAIEQPTKENLDAIRDSLLIEAALLRLLAKRALQGDQWQIPKDAIELALETRTLGAKTVALPAPDVLVFVHEAIGQADEHRRRGERALLVGRVSEARAELRLARGYYERAQAQIERVDRHLLTVKRLVLDSYGLIRWLAAAPDDWNRKPATMSRLQEFFQQFEELQAQPTPEALGRLAELAADLRGRADDYAQNAWQRNRFQQTHAALQLTWLSPEVRQHLLDNMLQTPDGNLLRATGRQYAVPRYDRPANPYPVADFIKRLDGSDALVDDLRRLDPNRPKPVLLHDVVAGRADRSSAGLEVRKLLQQLRSKPAEEPPGRSPWEQSLAHLLSAPVLAQAARGTRFEDSLSVTLAIRLQAEQVRWQLDRLLAEQANLPGDYDDTAVPALTATLRSLDPDAVPRSISPVFAAVGDAMLEMPSDTFSDKTLEVRSARDLVPGETATLVVDWYGDRQAWDVQLRPVDAEESPDAGLDDSDDAQESEVADPLAAELSSVDQRPGQGRLRIRLPNISVGETLGVPLRFAPASTAAPRGPRLAVWVELSSGSVDWLPIRIEPPKSKVAPVGLVLQRRERAGDPNTIDLYPNQQSPLQVLIRKNTPEAMNLTVQIDGGLGEPAVIPIETAEMQTGLIPVIPPKDLRLEIGDGRLVVRLVRGETLLDAQEVGVAILEPSAYVRPHVTYDPQQRRVIARVHRIAPSDSNQPTLFELDLPGLALEEGNLMAELLPDDNVVVLDAVVPHTIDDRTLEAVVSASGVPRAFFYQVGSRQTVGRQVSRLSLHIASPKSRTVYAADPKGGKLPIAVQVDGPPDLQVHTGADRNGNGILDVDERRAGGRYWAGRQVKVALTSAGDAPGFVVDSQVGDIVLPLDATGMIGRQKILVQLSAGNQTLSEELTVYFVSAAPEIVIEQPAPGTQVTIGRPFPVAVRCPSSLYGAVDRVEFAVDKNGNGQWDDDETLLPIDFNPEAPLRFGDSNELQARLPSTGLTPPETILLKTPDSEVTTLERSGGSTAPQVATLMARSVLRVVAPKAEGGGAELKSRIARQTIVLAPGGDEGIPPGQISGSVVSIDGSGQKGAFVSIEGVGTVQTGPDGSFRFDQVPPGDHQVTASTRTGRRSGAVPVTVESEKEAAAKITVLLKLPGRDSNPN